MSDKAEDFFSALVTELLFSDDLTDLRSRITSEDLRTLVRRASAVFTDVMDEAPISAKHVRFEDKDGIYNSLQETIAMVATGKITPTHRFIDGDVNYDTEWFKQAAGRMVVVTRIASDGFYEGIFCDDGLPFEGVSPERFEKIQIG